MTESTKKVAANSLEVGDYFTWDRVYYKVVTKGVRYIQVRRSCTGTFTACGSCHFKKPVLPCTNMYECFSSQGVIRVNLLRGLIEVGE